MKSCFIIIFFSISVFINSQNLIPVINESGKWGYENSYGKLVTPYQYDRTYDFAEGLGVVVQDDKMGIIDIFGKEILVPKYTVIFDYRNGFAAVELNDKWGFIDKNGKEIIPIQYEAAMSFSENFVAVNKMESGSISFLPVKFKFLFNLIVLMIFLKVWQV